ncbi:MAG: nucleoside 2-deoxyribosyltransferase [Solirubrobacteraceae bacterium]
MPLSDELHQLFLNGARPRCYVASPLGFSDATRGYYENEYLPALSRHVVTVDPWSLTSPAEVAQAEREGRLRAFFLEVAERNAQAIAGSDLLIAHLDGQEVDSGTAAEIGYAVGLGKPALGIRSDLRQAGEPEMAVNLQVEGLIIQSGGFVADSLESLLAALS